MVRKLSCQNDAADFKWLRNFLYTFALLTVLLLSEHVLGLFVDLLHVRSWYYFFAFAIITYNMAINAYAAKPIVKFNYEPALLLSYQEPLLLEAPVTIAANENWTEEWKAKIEVLMEVQQFYLDPELTLTEPARILALRTSTALG